MKRNKYKSNKEENSNSPFENKKKFCPFSQPGSPQIDYKDILNCLQIKRLRHANHFFFAETLKTIFLKIESSFLLSLIQVSFFRLFFALYLTLLHGS